MADLSYSNVYFTYTVISSEIEQHRAMGREQIFYRFGFFKFNLALIVSECLNFVCEVDCKYLIGFILICVHFTKFFNSNTLFWGPIWV